LIRQAAQEKNMQHKISTYVGTNDGDLNVIFLDQTGLPYAWRQDANGDWNPKPPNRSAIDRNPVAEPISIPVPAGTTFRSILGINFYGVIALDVEGSLWVTKANNGQNDSWKHTPFIQVNSVAGLTIVNFDADTVRGFDIVVAAIVEETLDVYAFYGDIGGFSDPVQIEGYQFTDLAIIGVDPDTGTVHDRTDNPTAIIVGVNSGGAGGSYSLASGDMVNWQDSLIANPAILIPAEGDIPQIGGYPIQAVGALVVGNPFVGSLNAFLVDTQNLSWMVTSDNQLLPQFQYSGTEGLNNPMEATNSSLAGGYANGNVYVAAISTIQPGFNSVIWQDAAGVWHKLHYWLPQGDHAIEVTDLAIGIGSQGVLQIAYTTYTDDIYVNWLDGSGTWQWYGPLAH
jgi:hypothetical protein